MEKLVLSLVFTAKRLRGYFQAHPIVVITDQPIKQIMSHPDVAGRLQKWSVMLGEHNITYWPRTSVKGQILADFLVEKPDENLPETPATDISQEPCTVFMNGSSCIDGSGAGLILTRLEGIEFTYALRFQFTASNNEAEYEALIAGLRIAAQMGVRNVRVSVDSKLVGNQVLGAYVAKEQSMIKYLEKVKSLVLVEILKEKFIHEEEVATKRGKQTPHKGQIVRIIRRDSLQAVISRTMATGIDIAGPFPKGSGEIISDNGKQFSDNPFKDWCDKLNITQRFASVKHPQSNGLVERANQSLGEGIKARLGEGYKNWVEELPYC
ncbi:reverse transcriptase domain-containing protein [Tanacetum coccineum]|uniref:Reverse transcriptase domain-containing protein n=1 Tax=Tanacetum coccineum TaxID=301880 RepID=A0ABQ5I2C2_9ASTR